MTAGVFSRARAEPSASSPLKRFLCSNTPVGYIFKAIDEFERTPLLLTQHEREQDLLIGSAPSDEPEPPTPPALQPSLEPWKEQYSAYALQDIANRMELAADLSLKRLGESTYEVAND